MTNDKRIYFATKGLIIKDGKFLALHKTIEKEDYWELPGGKMEYGETAEETIVREIEEETGLLIEPVRLLDTWNLVKDEFQITGVIYLCQVKKGELKLSPEHDKFEWLAAEKSSLGKMQDVFKDRMKNWDWDQLREN